ncbi:Glutamate receptor family protein [Prunus dulcis]|uniref:Glutamate receptor family protein n=1 Tax=Prunus dulcis TaxID=3755 RepID=A0A4Y1QZ55_PRUDU|nr:Glutamate receptor family protein [Prunus dulcis]
MKNVFKAVIEALPYKVHYEFIPFEDANGNIAGTYNELVYRVYPHAVVGDRTITWNRSLYVDFTEPFTDLGMGTLVPKEEETMWIFLKPLSADLWITSAGFFILTGFVVWLIEKPINQEFQGSPSQQIGTIFWFSLSTLVLAHSYQIGPFSKLGRIDFDFKGLEQFNQSEEAYIDALSRGNKPGGASVIIDETRFLTSRSS